MSMSDIEQLDQRVENLAPQELAKPRTCFIEFDAHPPCCPAAPAAYLSIALNNN
jgi:hypothetical protein